VGARQRVALPSHDGSSPPPVTKRTSVKKNTVTSSSGANEESVWIAVAVQAPIGTLHEWIFQKTAKKRIKKHKLLMVL